MNEYVSEWKNQCTGEGNKPRLSYKTKQNRVLLQGKKTTL